MNSCKPPETIAMECEFRLSSENSITLNSPHFRRRRSLRRLRSRTTPALAATARTTRPRPRPALPRSPTRTASRSTPMPCPTPRSTRKTSHAPAATPCIPRRPRKRPPRPSAAAATTRTPTNATPATSCRSVPSEADGSKEFARFRPRLQLRAAIAAAAWFGRLCHRFCMVRATTPISRGTTVQSMRVGASWPSQSAGGNGLRLPLAVDRPAFEDPRGLLIEFRGEGSSARLFGPEALQNRHFLGNGCGGF